MQNAKCKMQNEKAADCTLRPYYFAFCILNFALRIRHLPRLDL